MAPEDPDKAEYLIFPKWEPLIYDRKKKKKAQYWWLFNFISEWQMEKDLLTILIFNMTITLGDGNCN